MNLTRSNSAGQNAHIWNSIPTRCGRLFTRGLSSSFGLALLTALAYYAGTAIGFALTPHDGPISTLWPPNAILLAVLLLVPWRQWWIPLLAVMPAHLLYQLHVGVPISTSFGWYIANSAEALIGAACIQRFVRPAKLFGSIRGVVAFLVSAVIVAPIATSFLDVASVILTGWGEGYWTLWRERFLSNALAELIFVPLIVTFCLNSSSWIRNSTLMRYIEAFALASGLALAGRFVFDVQHTSVYSPALVYLPLSLLLWAALRFGMAGLSVSLLTIALISIESALHSRGPFTSASPHANVLSLQVLLCTVATPLVVLTTVMAERRDMERSLRELAHKLIGAQEQERQRIAQELHDDVGQQMALVSVVLDQLRNEVDSRLSRQVDHILEQVGQASQSARELSHGLHPVHLRYLGLESALRVLCQDVEDKKSLTVRFVADNLHSALPSELSLCLFRVAQEALQNVIRHSDASEVTVTVEERESDIALSVVDNGAGFEAVKAAEHGIGLLGMRERLTAVNGRIQVSSAPGCGTTVEAIVPLPTPNPQT